MNMYIYIIIYVNIYSSHMLCAQLHSALLDHQKVTGNTRQTDRETYKLYRTPLGTVGSHFGE